MVKISPQKMTLPGKRIEHSLVFYLRIPDLCQQGIYLLNAKIDIAPVPVVVISAAFKTAPVAWRNISLYNFRDAIAMRKMRFIRDGSQHHLIQSVTHALID